MVDQEESSYTPSEQGIQYESCLTLSDQQPGSNTDTTPLALGLSSSHLSIMPWAKVLPTKTVKLPYASPRIKPVGQVTLKASKGSSTCNLTFQVINTDQPALLSSEASKALGVLTLNADFIRKCSTSNSPLPPIPGPETSQESAAGPPPAPPNTQMRIWPKLGTLTLDFISKKCPSLLQGLGYLGPPTWTQMSNPLMPLSTANPSQS